MTTVRSLTKLQCIVFCDCQAPFTRYNLLSDPFDNRLNVCIHDTTSLTTGCIVYTAGCQTGCTTRYDNRLNEQWLFVEHGCQTGLTTGWTFVYMIQPVVKLVVQPV